MRSLDKNLPFRKTSSFIPWHMYVRAARIYPFHTSKPCRPRHATPYHNQFQPTAQPCQQLEPGRKLQEPVCGRSGCSACRRCACARDVEGSFLNRETDFDNRIVEHFLIIFSLTPLQAARVGLSCTNSPLQSRAGRELGKTELGRNRSFAPL